MATVNPSVLSCEPGQSWPLGACCRVDGGRNGVNFAVYSRHAERMELCLFDTQGDLEIARFDLPGCTEGVWHGFVAGLGAGQCYGFHAHGPCKSPAGSRFNPKRLLLDPFARAACGDTRWLALECDAPGPETPSASGPDSLSDQTDNAPRMLKAQVLDWAAERLAGAAVTARPQVPLASTVLYEAHVKGLTQLHPDVPADLRGRYAGLASAPLLVHYQRLGITTLCLLPVQLHIDELHLLNKGLRNYWGYNTLAYFIPEPAYASDGFDNVRDEFRYMVDQLHRHGLEVVLDVVYNHSAESDTFGPTLSWRGLDNASWYALDNAGHYLNFSGCGNSFNLTHPCAVQMVMDSLRWWVEVFGVDGFRFDLATSLGRDPALQHQFNPGSALLGAIAQDPVLAGVKLIAEPWDVGPGGYQLGQFPARWLEWNDIFRDTCRSFWLGFHCTRGDFARRLCGSSDNFDHDGRSPLVSINLITAHDGMTLADLTSYRHKHNLANGEGNQDGHHHNLSANAGVEGPTADEAVQALRGQWRRALLTTLLCSQGIPQLLAGDEFGQSQGGNNNAYCQDNEISWLSWPDADQALINFVAGLVHLRQAHTALRYSRWFRGHAGAGPHSPADIQWRQPDASAMTAADWDDPQSRSLACLIEVAELAHVATERWLLLWHADREPGVFALPPGRWQLVLDSAAALVLPQSDWRRARDCREHITITAPSVVGLVQRVNDSP
jgi:glycogen operon protein